MRSLLPLFYLLVFFGVFGGAIFYLAKRMSYFFDTGTTPWLITFVILLIFMIVGLAAFTNSKSFLGGLVYKDAALIMGFLLYFLMSVLLVDLGYLFFKTSPKIYGIIALGLTIIALIYGTWNSYNIRTTKIDIGISALSKEIKAVHLSDIHIGHFRGRNYLQKVVDRTNQQNPDIVFITGDLFDGKVNISETVLKPLTEIKVPVLFVNGNHDGYSGLPVINKMLRNLGIHVIENQVTTAGELQIIGLDHMRPDSSTTDMHAQRGPTIKDVLNQLDIDINKPTLLLHHSPDGIQYANEHGVDLYLAGHTHAGQLFPINLLNNLIFKYNKGLDNFKNTKILVSQGIGTFGPPMRIGTRSEVIAINLKPVNRES